VNLYHESTLARVPPEVMALVYEGKRELQAARPFVIGFLDGEEFTIWAETDVRGTPVGVLCVKIKDKGRVWWVDVAYVKPESRGLGVMDALRKQVREAAMRDAACLSLEYFVRADNIEMLHNVSRAGLSAVSHHFRVDVQELRAKQGGTT